MNYVKRKQQLDHILKDKDYWRKDNGFKEFLSDMHDKVSMGYSLSDKQETAITNAVSRYAKYFFLKNDPDFRAKVDKDVLNVCKIRNTLLKCNYHQNYEISSLEFLDSIEEQLRSRGSLSVKQRKALNTMYKRFKKKIESNA